MSAEDNVPPEDLGTPDKGRSSTRRRRRATGQAVNADQLELRIFTLADHAVVSEGKLYINGGGVELMFLPKLPGALGPLWLAIRIRVPWHMTGEPLVLRVRALDADRQPIGPDPIGEAHLEVGRAPGQRAGDELGVNLAFSLLGFPVEAESTIYFHLSVADEALTAVLPLKLGVFRDVGMSQR